MHSNLGAICLLLGSYAASNPWKVISHLTLRNTVSSLLLFLCFPPQATVLTSRREARAHLASIGHLTHFPTLTNASRRDVTWSDQPDEAGGHDPLKHPSVPVRSDYCQKKEIFYELLSLVEVRII